MFETGGFHGLNKQFDEGLAFTIRDLGWAGKGWELFLDAKIPEQIAPRYAEAVEAARIGRKPLTVGRYTVICDGATMAALLGQTLGVATQLDRAMGYEANAAGTSFITDPLGMVGNLQVASPLVTMTTNRSVPAQLATVQWDDEGVVPSETTLVTNGVLTDLQTTRESAGWLAPYYRRTGKPVRSAGHAAAEDALAITMQHMPNLALTPNQSSVGIADLVANVDRGVLIEGGEVWGVDSQARNGVLMGRMREITQGRLGRYMIGSMFVFNTLELWKKIQAVGGSRTQATVSYSRWSMFGAGGDEKGQPRQTTSYSVRAPAATIPGLAAIDPVRRA
jgi:TldD protein